MYCFSRSWTVWYWRTVTVSWVAWRNSRAEPPATGRWATVTQHSTTTYTRTMTPVMQCSKTALIKKTESQILTVMTSFMVCVLHYSRINSDDIIHGLCATPQSHYQWWQHSWFVCYTTVALTVMTSFMVCVLHHSRINSDDIIHGLCAAPQSH